MRAKKLLTKRQKKKLLSVIAGLVLLAAVALGQRLGWINTQDNPATQTQPGQYYVASFEDGDTITVDMNGIKERVRFIGVDTPETQDPRKPVQCFGKAASEFTRSLIGNQPLRLEADPLNTNRDRYNRLLRYIYLPDGRLVNAEIIRQGYGFAYTSFPFTKIDEFKAYEAQAREQNLGLWGACELTPNEYGGFTPAPEQ